MKNLIIVLSVLYLVSCSSDVKEESKKENPKASKEVVAEEGGDQVAVGTIQNEKIQNYVFLDAMTGSELYPQDLVVKGQKILKGLCLEIENKQPKTLEELYVLTHAATDQFNALAMEFDQHESEFETNAREITALDFEFIAESYGFVDADLEELIATREW